MDITEAIKILKDHNKWRIGTFEEMPMAEPRVLTEAINQVIAFAENAQALQLRQCAVISSVDCPVWLTEKIKKTIKELWSRPNNDNSNPRVQAVKLIRKTAEENGFSIDLKMSAEMVNKHCL